MGPLFSAQVRAGTKGPQDPQIPAHDRKLWFSQLDQHTYMISYILFLPLVFSPFNQSSLPLSLTFCHSFIFYPFIKILCAPIVFQALCLGIQWMYSVLGVEARTSLSSPQPCKDIKIRICCLSSSTERASLQVKHT